MENYAAENGGLSLPLSTKIVAFYRFSLKTFLKGVIENMRFISLFIQFIEQLLLPRSFLIQLHFNIMLFSFSIND